MAWSLKTADLSNPPVTSTFRSYLRNRLLASVLLMVAIISGTLYYFLIKALESQFLARALAEKSLAEGVLEERLQAIENRLKEIANNNTVKITLMLGVKPQLIELLREICPPAKGVHYFVQGGPDKEFFPDPPKTLIGLIKNAASHNLDVKLHLLPNQLTLIFARPIKRDKETIGIAYGVYNLSQDTSLDTQFYQIGKNWFYFLVPGGLKRLDNAFLEEGSSQHPHPTRQADFLPYTWGAIAGVTSRSYLFESLYYFVPIQPLVEIRNKMLYLIGGLSLLMVGVTQLFGLVLTRRLSSPLNQMAAEARAISKGERNIGFDLPGKNFTELQQLSQTFNSMLQQLHAAQEDSRFRELFDHVSDGVWIQDLEGNILETNEFGYRVLGFTLGELLGSKVNDICFPEEPAQVAKTIQDQGEAVYREWRQDRHLTRIPFEVKAKKIVYRGVACILTVARDITTLMKAEEFVKKQNSMLEDMVAKRTADLSKALADLELAKEGAESANIAKSQFLANMSHEIRTPIHGVLGIIDLLLYSEITDKQRELLEKARKSGEMLLVIINDIMDLSRIEASKLVLENISFDLAEVVEGVLELTGREADAKGLETSCLIDPETPLWLRGDHTRLRQILLNLLGNAIKFTPAGAIIVRVHCVQEEVDRAEIRVEVQDSGIGIAPEAQAGIFDPFCQGDGSTTRRFGGTGLGLAIVKHLVTAMAGKVGVVSEVEQGSTFWFSIPFKKDTGLQTEIGASEAGCPQCLPPVIGMAKDEINRRILLAEDNLVNQEVILGMLSHIGCQAEVVADGRQALEALARRRYDLVLMDCQMPEVDGYEATRSIRAGEAKTPPASPLPIIALTGYAMDGDRERCLAAGMDDYLSKPFNTAQLKEIVDKWLFPRDGATQAGV